MPGRKCSVHLCKNSSAANKRDGKIKSYFSFPRNENLRKKWIDACHNTIENIVTARVCSDHFKDEDYIHSNKSDTFDETRKKRLKFDVVPSLNLHLNAASSRKTFTSRNANKENSKDSQKRKNLAKDNENLKEVLKRKSSVLTSDKENEKETSKRKSSVIKADQNSLELLRRKNNSGNLTNGNSKVKVKKKMLPKSDEDSNQFAKKINRKGISNKENSKKLIKRRIHVKNNPQNTVPKRKIIKGVEKENSKEFTKKKSKINNNEDFKDISKNNIVKENSKEFPKKKISRGSCDKEQQPKHNGSLENNYELSKDLTTEGIGIGSTNRGNLEQVCRRKNSVESDEEYSDNLQKLKTTLLSMNGGNTKKHPKRKNSIDIGTSKRSFKKRIRLGRSDSEESEDSPEKNDSAGNKNDENGISRHNITYKNPSQMKDNVDLLNYLNYLKKKPMPTDQPILFWVDD